MKPGNKIVVIGSSNTDMVVRSRILPGPGETVLGGEFVMTPGGKGANQAVAAAKLGGDVAFITRVGNDMFGKQSIQGFQHLSIDTTCISIDQVTPSGIALIMVDENGENIISVAPGSNAKLQTSEVEMANGLIQQASLVLLQLEIPMEVVEYTVEMCHQLNVRVILNPAPARSLSSKLLSSLYMITPNESETEILTGIRVTDQSTAHKAATVIRKAGVEIVIITMGDKGAYILSDTTDSVISSIPVKAVDTTAAGDTFNGALAVGLAEGMGISEAVSFANKAAALSVTKIGAQVSIPFRQEVV